MEIDLNKRYQTMLTLWFALLMSVGIYFVIAKFAGSSRETGPNSLPIVAINSLGAVLVLMSFVVKRKLLKRSVETQNVVLAQKAVLLACAMCESCALLGVLERFAFGSRDFYLF